MSDQQGDLLTGEPNQPVGDAGNQDAEGPGDAGTPPVTDDSKNQKGLKGMLSSEALKNDERLDRFVGDGPVDKLAQSFLELEDKLGRAVTISDEPTDEELSRLRTLLGVPENVDGYDFSDVELPEGFKLTDGAAEDLKAFAKENDMSVTQAKKLLSKLAARENEAVRQVRQLYKEKRESAEAKLRQDLGEDYDKHVKAGKTWLERYGDDELKAELKDTGFGNSPALVRALGKAGLEIGEGQAPRGFPIDTTAQPEEGFPVAAAIAKSRATNYK
jgi:hypothetical protein